MPRRLALLTCLILAGVGLARVLRPPPTATLPDTPPPAPSSPAPSAAVAERFLGLMNAGKNHLDQGDAAQALPVYLAAAALIPNDIDVHLNLANTHLLAESPAEALREAGEVLKRDPHSAAAHFLQGSAHLRLSQPEAAVKALENARRIDPAETATCFQLGRARTDLQQWEAAITAFRQGLALDPDRLHTQARYLLAQALIRAGRPEEAQRELETHQAGLDATGPQPAAAVATFERSKYTQARVPFRLDQPDPEGTGVRFVDATTVVLGSAAREFSGPIAVIDADHTGWNSLFALGKDHAFRLLWNSNGTFHPLAASHPALPGAHYTAALAGDLQNDRFEDVVVLGDRGSHLFRFQTNGVAEDVSRTGRLDTVAAVDGALVDLDFTGKLDLVTLPPATRDPRIHRQLGPLRFSDVTATSGVPDTLRNALAIHPEDWNRDGTLDLIVSRTSGPPLLLEKQRGGRLVARQPADWVAGAVVCPADFDNDLRPDLAVAAEGRITVCLQGGTRTEIPVTGPSGFRQIVAFDHDNDGWLDLWGVGDRIRVWRNLGLAGFQEQTAALGLDRFDGGTAASIHTADFDMDCDSDVVVALAGGGLRYLRNDGGNTHGQVKVQLYGNRSNASGLGCRIEIVTGGLRLWRTIQRLPVEIGVGRHPTLDSFLVHWFNWPQGSTETPVQCPDPILALEATLQEGSCPYLYAWDGRQFRFVTDILGAAPLGLPVSEGRHVEADPEEFIWIGHEDSFPPRDGSHQLRITEELREVLYLDEARLVVVDHPPDHEVHPTDKLLPRGPFPTGTLLSLHREQPLREAVTLAGQDVTDLLRAVDARRVSPPTLRVPQLRGLAEPHGLLLDFGPLETTRPLVLVMNGWLRFGGGMANIAASHDPSLPFPFPTLEAELAPGTWEPLDVMVGAPAGKTKTVLVELGGKLKPGTTRLRLVSAFEIHWDRIALLQRNDAATTRITPVPPSTAELHFRGFSRLKDLPPDAPPTPDHDAVSPESCWTHIPGGWCTRYGDVRELIAARDEVLALVNAGDALTLTFRTDALPAKPPGMRRQFFLYVDGWDKDSDFHVTTGTGIEPLPFHGMDDQAYGRQPRPPFPGDALHRAYNTRWVEGSLPGRAPARFPSPTR